MPSPVIDRKNRETWQRDGEKSLWARAVDEVERRLAAYHPIETDPAVDAEMRRVIRSGMRDEAPLPLVPPAAERIRAMGRPTAAHAPAPRTKLSNPAVATGDERYERSCCPHT